jgi:prephenate dehydrogenase
MLLNHYLFRKATIVGIGFMGGSMGLALKKHRLAREVIGLSHRQSSLVNALKIKAIDVGHTDLKKALYDADLVILAAPVESIIKLFSTINPYLKRGCIVTDLGSTKAKVVESAEKSLSAPSFYVGSHPLTGSEKQGVENAQEDLFTNAQCIMTPTPQTNQVAKEKVKLLWTKIGSQVKFLSPEEHDQNLSYVSHLPHILAYGLMETVPSSSLEFGAQGFKDTTRIASSSPQMWNDICMANAKNVVKALDDLIKHLSIYRKAIVLQDQKELLQHFTSAKEKRDAFSKES